MNDVVPHSREQREAPGLQHKIRILIAVRLTIREHYTTSDLVQPQLATGVLLGQKLMTKLLVALPIRILDRR